MRLRNTIAGFVGLAALTVAQTAGAAPLNIIFYGNSFTLGFGSTRSVNDVFKDIATAAGQETPRAQSAAASGQTLNWHVNNNTTPLFVSIPLAENWDYIVMQEHSTKLTRTYTDTPAYPASIEQSKNDVVDLYDVAAFRSPDVVPVLYETWARGPGHSYYTGGTPVYPGGPSEMQAEIRSGYDQLKGSLDAAAGSDFALIAPVGDAWESINYDRTHAADLWHAQNRGTLLAALVIYATIYQDPTTSDIDLTGVLGSLGLTAQDGAELTAAADATYVPEPATLGLLGTALCLVSIRRR
ncbi:MAG: PEP-CTERM sorting domain-containing protein [Phycisphaerales bacterium]